MTESSEYYKIKFFPQNVLISVEKGTTILEAAEKAGLSINTECGGYGSCGKCKVKISKGTFKKQNHIEITEDELQDNIQLACITEIYDNLEVYIPEEKKPADIKSVLKERILHESEFIKDFTPFTFNYKPLLEVITLRVDPPTIENNSDDFDRIARKIIDKYHTDDIRCPVSVLKNMPDRIREKDGEIFLSLSDNGNAVEIIGISSHREKDYGLAVDIGTTTAAVLLVDLDDGRIVSERSEYNQQISCGPDIINRIIYASKNNGLDKLKTKILSTINGLIDDIINDIGIKKSSIKCCSIAGNTTMDHLLLGINPKYIREEPYVPAVLSFPNFRAKDLMLNINDKGVVYLTPGISSYVGGDITAGVLQAGINRSEELTLFVDLGTNGEIVLGNAEWMTACACSAGPAFEGGGLKSGMRAAPGAVNKTNIDKETGLFEYEVIGDIKPKGICGSAVIDIVADLYFSHIINQKGKFDFENESVRLRKGRNYNEYMIIPGSETFKGGDIVITEQDLDNIIRTKGAIWAGISTLLKAVQIKADDIDRIIIAGAFGNYINIENAILIGMFPDVPVEKYSFIGNGSLQGAALTLVSDEMRNEINEISNKITNLELSSIPGYMEEFVASLFLPHTDSELFPSFVKKRNSGL